MLGPACALGAALLWSTSVILFKRSEAVSPQAMNLFKNVVALTLLLITLPIMGQGLDWDRDLGEWWLLILSGALGIALADTLVFMALRRLGASLLAVVDCAYSPVIITFGVVVLGERLSTEFLLGGALVVGGVLVATTEGLGRPAASAENGADGADGADRAEPAREAPSSRLKRIRAPVLRSWTDRRASMPTSRPSGSRSAA